MRIKGLHLTLIVGVAVAALFCWPTRQRWPPAVYQPFSSWGDGWELPPRPSGAYMVYLVYCKKDGGRLDSEVRRTDIKLSVRDETTGKDVQLFRNWEYGEIGPDSDWQFEQVANIWLIEGHRYRIDVDAEQLKELRRYRHCLGVDLDVTEKMNWGKPKGRRRDDPEKGTGKWEPRELEKAKAARKAWEEEKARRFGTD